MDNVRAASAVVEPPSLLESTNDEATSAENPLEPTAAPEIFQMVLTEYQRNLASRVASYMNDNYERPYLPPLQGRSLKEIVTNMNTVLSMVNTSLLVELCNLCYCAARVVSEECGVKLHNPTSNSSPPPWETRILSKLKRLKLDQSRLRELRCGRLKSQHKIDNLVSTYDLRSWSVEEVCEELHQTVKNLSHSLKRYRHNQSCRQQNKLFQSNQHKFYQQTTCQSTKLASPPREDTLEFWNNLWSVPIRKLLGWIVLTKTALQWSFPT